MTVLRHGTADFRGAAISSAIGGFADVTLSALGAPGLLPQANQLTAVASDFMSSRPGDPSDIGKERRVRDLAFDVIGRDTGTRYRIHTGRTLNIAQLNASGECACRVRAPEKTSCR